MTKCWILKIVTYPKYIILYYTSNIIHCPLFNQELKLSFIYNYNFFIKRKSLFLTELEFRLISPFNDSSHGGVMHDSEMKWRINWHYAWKLSQSSGFLSCSRELRSDWRSSRALDSCSYLRQTTDAHSHDPKHSMARKSAVKMCF